MATPAEMVNGIKNGVHGHKYGDKVMFAEFLFALTAALSSFDRHAASQVESPGTRSATHLGVPDLGNAHAKGNTPGSHACPPADHAALIIHSSSYPGHLDDPTTTCSRPEAAQKQQRLDRPPTRHKGWHATPGA